MQSNESATSSLRLAVIDYGMGNLHSVVRAWETTGAQVQLVHDPRDLSEPDALIFPGQGAIVDAMDLLQKRQWDRFIREWIAADRPFFGICLGLQALFEHSEEGNTRGLGIFEGSIKRFNFARELELKVPHMGWNPVFFRRPAFRPSSPAAEAPESYYFVHSYYCDTPDADLIWGETEYGPLKFCSAISRGNVHATQFHPEKSQADGLKLYRQFCDSLLPA